MSDLAQRLAAFGEEIGGGAPNVCGEAADELTRLQCLVRRNVAIIDEQAAEIERYEETLHRLNTWLEAYPKDIFTPLKGDPIKKTGDYDTAEKRNLITRASASMARHIFDQMPKIIREALAEQQP